MSHELCDECWRYKTFKKKCHYFWDDKIECSMFMDDELSEPRHHTRLG
ncbi:hypothetical protein GOV05_03465 [Candidatus Woesearchaeota archaeon]|nr:hypothetical protein [Candidatus Woesearchaeota archaeon]